MPNNQSNFERRPSGNQSDNLWRNYKKLCYLEESRNQILCRVHENRTSDVEEKRIRKESFQGVEEESNLMFEQIRQVLLRMSRLATYDRHLLETCIKIVDEEEKRDNEPVCACSEHEEPFVVPGRPKRWKEKCLEVIKSEIAKRVDEVAPSPVDEKKFSDSEAEARLLSDLTAARDNIEEDLRQAKAISDAFTNEWHMYNTYTKTYYDELMKKMEERFSFDQTGHAGTVQVLSWMICCRDQVFDCKHAICNPCQIIVQLQERYLREKQQNINEWMTRALRTDINDWKGDKKPTADREGALYTEFPIHILQMLKENISQARDISSDLHAQISRLCLEELQSVMACYTVSAKNYISLASRKTLQATQGHRTSPTFRPARRSVKNSMESRPTFYVEYSVALLNNFDKITEGLQNMKVGVKCTVEEGSTNNNSKQWQDKSVFGIIERTRQQTDECSALLLPQILYDVNSELNELLRKTWLAGNAREAVDSICDVMTSYLRHLRVPVRSCLIPTIEKKIVAAYLRGLIEKRIVLNGSESERLRLHDKLHRECNQTEKLFQDLNKHGEGEASRDHVKSDWMAVREMANVIRAGDTQTAVTEITVLANEYPDVTEQHIRRLLKVRGGFSKSDIKKILSSSVGNTRRSVKRVSEKTVFSLV